MATALPNSWLTPGVVPHPLPAVYPDNFTDCAAVPDGPKAHVAADPCCFCHDAPCMMACTTSIDAAVHRPVRDGHTNAAAKMIVSQNIPGGLCAETLRG